MFHLVNYDDSSSSDEDCPDTSKSNVKDAEPRKDNHVSPPSNSDDQEISIINSVSSNTNANDSDILMEDVSIKVEIPDNTEHVYRQQTYRDISVSEDDSSSSSSSDEEDSVSSASSDEEDVVSVFSHTDDESLSNVIKLSSVEENSDSCLNVTTESINVSSTIKSTDDRKCAYCNGLKNSSTINNNKEASRNNIESNIDGDASKRDNGESTNLNNNNTVSICETAVIDIDISIDDTEVVERNSKQNSVGNLNVTNCDGEDKSKHSCVCGQNKKIQNPSKKDTRSKKSKKGKKKATFEEEIELPAIENLQVSVEENEVKPIGKILHFVQNMVVVQSKVGSPTIDFDSILFLDRGKRALGQVANIFGHISEPHYVVNFKSAEHIKEMNIHKDDVVFYAPQTEHTSYVILDNLLNAKGSDASWRDDLEPPVHCLDYSDDEEERAAKAALKAKKKGKEGEIVIVGEFESERKKRRVEGRNPFRQNFQAQSSYSRPRYTASRFGNNLPNSRGQNPSNDFHRSGIRFGGPPNFRAGARSPFVSPTPGFNNGSRGWNGGSVASSSGFHSRHVDLSTPPPSHNYNMPPPSPPSLFNALPPPSSPSLFQVPPPPSSPSLFNVPPPPSSPSLFNVPPPISQTSNNSFGPPQIHNPPPPFPSQGFTPPLLNQSLFTPPNQLGHTPQAVFHNQSVPPPNVQHPVVHMPPPFTSPNIPQMQFQQHISSNMQNPSQCLPPISPQYRQPSFQNMPPNNNQNPPRHLPSNSASQPFRPPR